MRSIITIGGLAMFIVSVHYTVQRLEYVSQCISDTSYCQSYYDTSDDPLLSLAQ